MMDCPTASSSLAWKRRCSSSLLAMICTSIKCKTKPASTVCGSSRLRHWLHSSEAPKYGSELLSLYQQLVLQYIAYTRGFTAQLSLSRHFKQ